MTPTIGTVSFRDPRGTPDLGLLTLYADGTHHCTDPDLGAVFSSLKTVYALNYRVSSGPWGADLLWRFAATCAGHVNITPTQPPPAGVVY